MIIVIGNLFGGKQGMIIAFFLAALTKLGRISGRTPMDANPDTAHMFIVNPLSGRSLANLFYTHPPLEDRIARLRNMNRG